jgi:hypothetical protein
VLRRLYIQFGNNKPIKISSLIKGAYGVIISITYLYRSEIETIFGESTSVYSQSQVPASSRVSASTSSVQKRQTLTDSLFDGSQTQSPTFIPKQARLLLNQSGNSETFARGNVLVPDTPMHLQSRNNPSSSTPLPTRSVPEARTSNRIESVSVTATPAGATGRFDLRNAKPSPMLSAHTPDQPMQPPNSNDRPDQVFQQTSRQFPNQRQNEETSERKFS